MSIAIRPGAPSRATALLVLAFAVANTAGAQGVGDCPSGLVSYWHLDEAASGSYADFIGTNDGVCGGTCPASDPNGKLFGAQLFDRGLSTEINAPGSDFNFGVGASFSVELWLSVMLMMIVPPTSSTL